MKNLSAALVVAVLLSLSPVSQASASTSEDDTETVTKERWELKPLTCRVKKTCKSNPDFIGVEKTRITNPEGAGKYVYWQIRKCGEGKWKSILRETTTDRGVFDMYRADYDPKVMKKYKVKQYDVKFPNLVQFSTFIPGDDTHKPVRHISPNCFG